MSVRRVSIFLTSLQDVLTEAKEHISFDRVHKYLPFPTLKRAGDHYEHLINDSIYPIELERFVIREGESLCRRAEPFFARARANSPCPGCFAIAKGLAVRDLR
jgi:hypothetical protein